MLGQASARQRSSFFGHRPFGGWGNSRLTFFAGFENDFTFCAVYGDGLPVLDPACCNTRTHYSRDTVFAGDNAAMAEWPANVGDYGGGHGKERRPGGGGSASD